MTLLFDRYFYNKVVTAAEVFISFGIKEDLHDDHKEMMQKAIQNTMVSCEDAFTHT